jgi:hypothetical protein
MVHHGQGGCGPLRGHREGADSDKAARQAETAVIGLPQHVGIPRQRQDALRAAITAAYDPEIC